MAIISDFQDDEAPPRQQAAGGADVEEALAALLERCGGALPFLQAAIGVAHRRTALFRDPSAVSKVTAMAAGARAQVEAEERAAREAKRKVEEAEWKAGAEAEKAANAAAAVPAAEKKPESSVKKDSMEVDKKEDGNVRREYSILDPFSFGIAIATAAYDF
jgi:xanthine dehydrogenase iron-sulfur cluster and FAD-binding subunit A